MAFTRHGPERPPRPDPSSGIYIGIKTAAVGYGGGSERFKVGSKGHRAVAAAEGEVFGSCA